VSCYVLHGKTYKLRLYERILMSISIESAARDNDLGHAHPKFIEEPEGFD
jgi:hypothetical protein